MFLTHDQMRDLTGTTRRDAQIRCLAQNGIRYTLDVHGWPKVHISAVTGTEPIEKEWRWNGFQGSAHGRKIANGRASR